MNYDQDDMAKHIAEKSFKGKKDLAGEPYFHHLERVAENFEPGTYRHCVSYLHDLLEDCPEWNETSLRALFDNRIVVTVVALTKLNNEDYFDYIERVKADYDAKQVKIADLEDNMNIQRLNKITDKDIERLKKYHKAYKILTS